MEHFHKGSSQAVGENTERENVIFQLCIWQKGSQIWIAWAKFSDLSCLQQIYLNSFSKYIPLTLE